MWVSSWATSTTTLWVGCNLFLFNRLSLLDPLPASPFLTDSDIIPAAYGWRQLLKTPAFVYRFFEGQPGTVSLPHPHLHTPAQSVVRVVGFVVVPGGGFRPMGPGYRMQ